MGKRALAAAAARWPRGRRKGRCRRSRRGKVLLHVARADGSLRPELKRPAMMRSSLVHGRALDALVQGADEEGEGSAARLAGAADALGIHLRPGQEIVDGANAVPDA